MTTLALSDSQLRFITACCEPLPREKRSLFLQRMTAFLEVRDRLRHPTDDDLEAACRAALLGLVQKESEPTA